MNKYKSIIILFICAIAFTSIAQIHQNIISTQYIKSTKSTNNNNKKSFNYNIILDSIISKTTNNVNNDSIKDNDSDNNNIIFVKDSIISQNIDSLTEKYENSSILNKINIINTLGELSDTIPYIYFNSIVTINQKIYKELCSVLKNDSIRQYIDSIKGLNIVSSKDKKLYGISWYENTGGSFKSYISLIHYQTLKKVGYINGYTSDYDNTENEDLKENNNADSDTIDISWLKKIPLRIDNNGYIIDTTYNDNTTETNNIQKKDIELNGGNIDSILKVNNDTYLICSNGFGCNTCMFDDILAIKLTNDSIQTLDLFHLDYREGDNLIENNNVIEIKNDNSTIKYNYIADDLTPVSDENMTNTISVKGVIRFNGNKFVQIKQKVYKNH